MEASLPDSSSGNHSLPSGYLAVTGQTIAASQHNPPLEDLSAAMSRRYMRDGRSPMLGNIPMNGYRATGAAQGVDPSDYVTKAQMEAAIAAVASVPTGMLTPMTSVVVPMGWLLVNGQEVLRATYPALWAHAQASGMLAATQGAKTHGQFGPGNGATTFTLPNLYADDGYFIRPMAAGRTIGSVQADEFRSHGHTGTAGAAGLHTHIYNRGGEGFGSGGTGAYTGGAGSYETTSNGEHTHPLDIIPSGGAETRPKNIAYPVIIKI